MTTATLRAAIFTCTIGVQFLMAVCFGHRNKELGAIAASIAMTGIATIMVATALKNRELQISHWLIANSFGAIVALTLVWRYLGDAARDLAPALWSVARQTAVAGVHLLPRLAPSPLVRTCGNVVYPACRGARCAGDRCPVLLGDARNPADRSVLGIALGPLLGRIQVPRLKPF